jgi:hypothetical protein
MVGSKVGALTVGSKFDDELAICRAALSSARLARLVTVNKSPNQVGVKTNLCCSSKAVCEGDDEGVAVLKGERQSLGKYLHKAREADLTKMKW